MNGNLRVILELINKNFNRNITQSSAQLYKFKQHAKQAGKDINLLQNSIGKASIGVGAFTTSLTGLATKGNFALMALTALGAAGVDSIKRFKEFEQHMADFQAILGVSTEHMEYFEAEAIRLGATTTQTSSQVADAFTRIAGKLPQLLSSKEGLTQVTEASITLAEAAGITVDEAGTALANAINQMGASAHDAAKYINVLAAGSRNGAGNIEYLTDAMKKIGSTTHSVGMSFEQTVAAVEMLAKSGIVAGSAGRQLRAVIGRLEKQMDEDLKPSVVGIDRALENLAKKQMSSAQYFHMFGVENQNAARILAEGREEYELLTRTITGTNTAYDQATMRVNTLAGATKRLDSAWEELCLTVASGDFWKNIVDGAAEALGLFNDFTLKVVNFKAWQEKQGRKKAQEQAPEYQEKLDKAATTLVGKINPLTKQLYTTAEAYEEVLSNLPKYLPDVLNHVDKDKWEKERNMKTTYMPGALGFVTQFMKGTIPADNTNAESKALMEGAMYYLAGKIDAERKKEDEKNKDKPFDPKEVVKEFDTTTKAGLKSLIEYLSGMRGQYTDDPTVLNQIETLIGTYQKKLDNLGKYIPKPGSLDFWNDEAKENRRKYNAATTDEERLQLNIDYKYIQDQIKKATENSNIEIEAKLKIESQLQDVTQEIKKQEVIYQRHMEFFDKATKNGETEVAKHFKDAADIAKEELDGLMKKQKEYEDYLNRDTFNNLARKIKETQKEIDDYDFNNGQAGYDALLIKLAKLNQRYAQMLAYRDKFLKQPMTPEEKQKAKKEYKNAKYGAVMQTTDAVLNLGDTIEDLFNRDWGEMSAWEKISAGVDIIAGTIDTVHSLIETWQTVIALKELFAGEGVKAAADATAVSTAETTKATAVAASQTEQTTAAVAGSVARTKAYKTEMAAASAAAYAPIPFAAVGLAGGQIASFQAMIIGAAALEDGGIIQSPFTTGDKNLVRVNGGEMVLNKSQQYNLFKLLDEGGTMGNAGGQVEFKIKGTELAGVLKNYNNKFTKLH